MENLYLRGMTLIVIFSIYGFGCTHLSASSAPGTYIGEYGGGTETLTIRTDGTFLQVYVKNNSQIYSNEGKWDIDGGRIDFSPFIEAFNDQNSSEPPKKYDLVTAHWDGMYPRIIFSDEGTYWVVKQ